MGLTPDSYTSFHKSRPGSTVYVLGSGSSLDHVPIKFFDDKIVVAINRVGETLRLREYYSVTHYHLDAHIIADNRPDLPVIAPLIDQGLGHLAPVRPTQSNVYFVETSAQMYSAFDCAEHWPLHTDHLVCGPTSLHMGMHFAAYLGASYIILGGADCGTLDSSPNLGGYSVGDNPFSVWDEQLPKVARKLRSMGVTVMSLNPFVNFGLEGHQYRSPSVSIN